MKKWICKSQIVAGQPCYNACMITLPDNVEPRACICHAVWEEWILCVPPPPPEEG